MLSKIASTTATPAMKSYSDRSNASPRLPKSRRGLLRRFFQTVIKIFRLSGKPLPAKSKSKSYSLGSTPILSDFTGRHRAAQGRLEEAEAQLDAAIIQQSNGTKVTPLPPCSGKFVRVEGVGWIAAFDVEFRDGITRRLELYDLEEGDGISIPHKREAPMTLYCLEGRGWSKVYHEDDTVTEYRWADALRIPKTTGDGNTYRCTSPSGAFFVAVVG